jgi:molybdenum cofactor cytidylyltransferase
MEEAECLVPAAGAARRMGEWKPVLPFRGSTIVETVVATALEACPRVVLVTGYRAPDLEGIFRTEPRVKVARNTAWEMGMFSSIQHGVRLIQTGNFFITPADMPLITSGVYRALLEAAFSGPDRTDAVFPVFKGSRGHPALLTRRVAEAVLGREPASGTMKEVLRGFRVRELPWPDDSVLRDVDTREDYARLPKPAHDGP